MAAVDSIMSHPAGRVATGHLDGGHLPGARRAHVARHDCLSAAALGAGFLGPLAAMVFQWPAATAARQLYAAHQRRPGHPRVNSTASTSVPRPGSADRSGPTTCRSPYGHARPGRGQPRLGGDPAGPAHRHRSAGPGPGSRPWRTLLLGLYRPTSGRIEFRRPGPRRPRRRVAAPSASVSSPSARTCSGPPSGRTSR